MNFLQIRFKKSATMVAFALVTSLAPSPAPAMGRRTAAAPVASNALASPAPTGPTQKILLLSSLDMSGVRLPFYLFWKRRYYRNYEYKLEQDFKWFYEGQGYEVETRRGSDQFDLWTALHSPDYVAVFWVSHSAAPSSSGVGLDSDGIIADWDGFDVGPALAEAHPNLRFLGVVGCKSEQVLVKRLIERGIRQSNPDLEIQAYGTRVDARRGLYRMQLQAQPRLNAVRGGYESGCPERSGHALTIHRTFSRIGLPNPIAEQRDSKIKFLPSVRLETANGVTLGVFPQGNGMPQDLTVYLPAGAPVSSAFELKLIENSGENPSATSDEIELGDLEFSEPWPGARWQVFANREGRPLGSTSRVYRYMGMNMDGGSALSPESAPAPTPYRPFVCAPMPPARANVTR